MNYADNRLLAVSPGHRSFGASMWTGMTLGMANGWRRPNPFPPRRDPVDRYIREMTDVLHYFIGATDPDAVIVEYLSGSFSDRGSGFRERTNLREIAIVESTLGGSGMKVKGHFKEDIAGYFLCSYPRSRITFVKPKVWMEGESVAAVQYRAERLILSGEIKTGGPIGISKRAVERRKALTAIALGWWGVNRMKVEGMESR